MNQRVGKSNTEYRSPEVNELEGRKARYFRNSAGSEIQKLQSLMRYMSRQDLAKLLCYYDVFKSSENIAGSIIECGVYFGNGLMTWAKLSAALEPYNYNCKVFGFDTFEGNQGVSEKDESEKSKEGAHHRGGGYFADCHDDLTECMSIYNEDRPLNHLKKVELIRGDIRETAQQFVLKNKHILVRVLSLSVNLYEPTLAAMEAFLPRMGKGSIIVPFTMNVDIYPGMTLALLEKLEIKNYTIKTPYYYPNFNYIIL
jgi:Macrocin-O-methyltransferase (TylF)